MNCKTTTNARINVHFVGMLSHVLCVSNTSLVYIVGLCTAFTSLMFYVCT